MTGSRSFLVTVLMTGLSACVTDGGTAIGPIIGPAGCVENAASHIKGVDWAEARIVTVRIRQDEFEPMVIGIRQDSPYIFRIENRDDYEHFFMASSFFRSVAIARINNAKKILKESCISGVRIGAMETVELQLVAVRDGRYEYMDKMFSLPSLGSMAGIISVDMPLKYIASLAETAEAKKLATDSAAQGVGDVVTPAQPQQSDANPFDAVEPAQPQQSDANPFDAAEPAQPQPSDANPFDAAEPAQPQPSDASPFDAVEPAQPQPSDANPFDVVEPAQPQPSDANPFETAKPIKPPLRNLTPFDTAKPAKSSVPISGPPVGSVPDPFDSVKPVLHNIQIPDPFPDMGAINRSNPGSSTPTARPKQEKSDTLGTDTPAFSMPVVGGDENLKVPPPPSASKGPSAKPKPDIKAKIRAKVKGFFDSLLGN